MVATDVFDRTCGRFVTSASEVSTVKPILVGFASGTQVVSWSGTRVSCGTDVVTTWESDIPDLADVGILRDQVWIATITSSAIRRFGFDGTVLPEIQSTEPLRNGRWATSPFSNEAVWHRETATPFGGEGPVALPSGEVAAPLVQGRWLSWQAGYAGLVRSAGVGWRVRIDDPAASLIGATPLIDGRLLALATRHAGSPDVRLVVLAARDGEVMTSMRLGAPNGLRFAARRGAAIVQFGKQLELLDLRLGRSLRQLQLPTEIDDFVVDDTLQHIAWLEAGERTPQIRSIGELPPAPPSEPRNRAADPPPIATSESAKPVRARMPRGTPNPMPLELVYETGGDAAPLLIERIAVPPPPLQTEAVEPSVPHCKEPIVVPTRPLLALRPRTRWPRASDDEIKLDLDARLAMLAASVSLAIAEAWDSGSLAHPDPRRPPFTTEVSAILGVEGRLAPEMIQVTRDHYRRSQATVRDIERARMGRLTPLEIMTLEFGLNALATAILLLVGAPSLRGEYARLYGVLANDPSRPLCDEHLLVQILGRDNAHAISRELDCNQPLRRGALLSVAAETPRPFAALTLESLALRLVRNLPLDAEPDPYLERRVCTCTLASLKLPAAPVHALLDELTRDRRDPIRIVVRGRQGSGRRSLCAALAALANRTLGIIDLSSAPHDHRLVDVLSGALRRATVRGWIPCIEGLEHSVDQDRDLRAHVTSVLRQHSGPLCFRVPPEVEPPLDPGFIQIDLPTLEEQQRERTWIEVTTRRGLPEPEASELAARYRIGPGIIERVCSEIAASQTKPADGRAVTAAADAAIRRYLDQRVSSLAKRVTRLATWSDVSLPEDVLDSIIEITGRVRHRRTVFEKWGYGDKLTTSRGITALFSGGPGTGKTMVAGVLARDLGLELYRIDVSRITSKWIGETEKNLGELFDAAEDGQVMLLFDEADSLFAKRTEVKSSVDRYANMEVNYLLQRLDSFEGIAILTSNFGTAIDPAFRRRLSFRVTFPFPDEEMREQIWRSLVPRDVPRSGEIDFASLARRFTLSGGYIRNASLRAAFLAAEEAAPLSQDHIERAVRAEFREIGKLAESGRLD
jgi:ATP-dependent 26S proteasome regulatory subunit